jgi:hypothetical protein
MWLQLLANQLEPLTEQQLMGITNLQQSSQQAEDALSQGRCPLVHLPHLVPRGMWQITWVKWLWPWVNLEHSRASFDR